MFRLSNSCAILVSSFDLLRLAGLVFRNACAAASAHANSVLNTRRTARPPSPSPHCTLAVPLAAVQCNSTATCISPSPPVSLHHGLAISEVKYCVLQRNLVWPADSWAAHVHVLYTCCVRPTLSLRYEVGTPCRFTCVRVQNQNTGRRGMGRKCKGPFEGRIWPLALRAHVLVSLAAVAPLFRRPARCEMALMRCW